MKFVKENSYEISKLFVNQIGISIFALSLSFAVQALDLTDHSRLRIYFFISLFSLAFFGVLLYLAAWEMGSKDKVRADSGKLIPFVTVNINGTNKKTMKRGILLAVFATLPQIVLSFICFLLYGIYLLSKIDALQYWGSFFNIVLRLASSQYAGVLQAIFSFLNNKDPLYFFFSSIGYVILSAYPVGITVLGYAFGFRDVKIARLFTKKS